MLGQGFISDGQTEFLTDPSSCPPLKCYCPFSHACPLSSPFYSVGWGEQMGLWEVQSPLKGYARLVHTSIFLKRGPVIFFPFARRSLIS